MELQSLFSESFRMALLFFLIFAAIWYLPLYLKHRKIHTEPVIAYIAAFALGIASAYIAARIQIGYAILLYNAGIIPSELPTAARVVVNTLKTLIVIAGVEEVLKCLGGSLTARRIPDLSRAGCMLIFGMVGLGFEFTESVISGSASDIFVGILRGVTDLHIFWQIWMGMYLWEAWDAKKRDDRAGYKKNILLAILIPIAVHFVFDWLTLKGNALVSLEDGGAEMLGMAAILGYLIVGIVFIIITLRRAYKVLKEEKAAAESAQPKEV